MKVCSDCDRCFDDGEVYCSEAAHSPLEDIRPGGPEMIDGYRLETLLSSGLKGDAYRACHIASGRSCRIRILPVEERKREQFLSEANLAAAIFHPNLADVYDAGILETGQCYVVAEDPDGQSLRALLGNVGVPSLLTSIQVVRQAAEAVHALHLKGMTHGALCPENLILASDSEHRLVVRIQNPDFGGAGQNAIVFNKFFIDTALEPLRYFAPEQCVGEPAGAKSDIYSLGIILYEMLSGSPPFDADTAAALIQKHKEQRPADIRIDDFDLRMLLAHTLMEALTKSRERRQSSANAFARQMRHIEQLATHVSTPPPAVVAPPAPRITGVFAASAAPAGGSAARPIDVREAENIVDERVTHAVRERETEYVSAPRVISDSASYGYEGTADAKPDKNGPLQQIHPEPDPITPSQELSDRDFTQDVNLPPPTPHNSRLRVHRRKLHSRSTTPPPEERSSNANVAETASSIIASPPAPIGKSNIDSEPQPAAQVVPAAKPIKIDWDQNDDIPSMDDVLAVLAKEPAPEPAIVAERLPQVIAPAVKEPKPSEICRAKPVMVENRRAEPKRNAMAAVPKRPVALSVATAPARRRALGSASIPKREVEFFPTILGKVDPGEVLDRVPAGSILSSYQASSTAGFPVRVRSLLTGGGALALIALILFGSDSVSRLASIETPAEPAPAMTALTAQHQVQAERPEPAADTAQKPEAVKVKQDGSLPAPNKELSSRSSESRHPAPSGSAAKTALPSPRSTTQGKTAQAKLKPELVKQASRGSSTPSPLKIAGATRPRIVNVPQP